MTMKQLRIFSALLIMAGLISVLITSCKKEDEPSPLKLTALVAGTIDLNGAVSPNTVPVDVAIKATFNVNVDPATATSANIKLKQNYDNADIALNIAVNGKEITITPEADLGTGTLYELSFGAGLLSDDGLAITALTRTFTTIGTFSPAGVVAHYTFEDNANDVVGSYDPSAVVSVTYTASRNTAAGKAATFDGDASIIEIPNGDQLITGSHFTISFWVKTNSTNHVDAGGNPAGHFVLGMGAFYGLQYEIYGGYDGSKFAIRYETSDGKSVGEDMWFPSLATSKDNGGWKGWDFAKSLETAQMQALLKDTWLHVTYTYEGSTKKGTLYFNGEKMKSFDFNLWGETDDKYKVTGLKWGGSAPDVEPVLALGFIQSRGGTMWDNEPWGGYDFPTANHFKGQLDDLRIFHKTLTATEIDLMYKSEKP